MNGQMCVCVGVFVVTEGLMPWRGVVWYLLEFTQAKNDHLHTAMAVYSARYIIVSDR